MTKPTIYFTVSMWNRMEHFKQLLADFEKIYEQDPDVALYVTDFCTVDFSELSAMVDRLPFQCRVWQVAHEFCNGMGHNVCIHHITEPESLVAVIAVDLQMPPDITTEIRKHAVAGETFYGPGIRYACKDGRLKACSAAYAMIAASREDFRRAGRLQQNMMWGGDRREGGEDITLMKQLKIRAMLRQRRPYHPGLICRWHERDTSQTFYQSFRRYGTMPWWNLVDADGKPVPPIRRTGKKRKKR